MTAEGEIIVMPPAYSLTSARNSDINGPISVTNYCSFIFNNFRKISFFTMLH